MSDTAPLSDELMVWLSAYVDGALSEEERAEVDTLAARDPRVAAELEMLFALNDDLRAAFDTLLEEPMPAAWDVAAPDAQPADAQPASQTQMQMQPQTPIAAPANTNRAPWRAMAAMLLIGLFLGAGSMWVAQDARAPVQSAAARSWLAEVAEYHQIYARQSRHLVEVPASEQAHIEAWLGKEIGFAFRVPDLSTSGWSFQGARLLVAAGKPVAQLMYTDAAGRVIALCALQNASGAPASPALRAFGDVHMATWKSSAGSFAIVGEVPAELEALAGAAAPLI